MNAQIFIHQIVASEDHSESGKIQVTLSHGQASGLYAHNYVRSLHGVPPLTWNQELAVEAKKWAHTLAHKRTLQHAEYSEEFSDNLYLYHGASKPIAAYKAVHKWYSQIKDYPFDTHMLKSEHYFAKSFAAMVWDEVQFLGMGISHSVDTKESYVVARYSPKPNFDYCSHHVKPQLIHKVGNTSSIFIPPIEDLIPPYYTNDKVSLYA